MKTSFLRIGTLTFFIICIALACQDENELIIEQQRELSTTAAKDNNEIVAAAQEVMDITDGVLFEKGITGGRKGHPNWNCRPSISGSFDIDKSHEDSVIYTGTLIIDYGDGSSCEDSLYLKKGKIINAVEVIVSFSDGFIFSKTQNITFEGFYKDSIQLDGSFVSYYASDTPTVMEMTGAMITYPDGTFTTWNGEFTFTLSEDEDDDADWFKNRSTTITGSASGATREGSDFSLNITEGIFVKYDCTGKHHRPIPVSGLVEITVAGMTSEVNYGDGTCDKIYTVTANGETTEHSLPWRH